MQSHATPPFSRRLKRSGGSLAAPALVPHPKAACRAMRIGPMRCRERRAAHRATRRHGESEARTAPSAAAMMLGRQILIADQKVRRRHASEPARPVALCIGGHVRPAEGVAGGGDLGASRCQHRRADTLAPDGARRSPLAMPIGTAAECAGAANRAAVPGADAGTSTGLIRMRVGSGGSKRGEGLDQRGG